MRRSRKIAISVVLCAILGSVAYGDFTATETPSSANLGGSNVTMRTILSLRNNSTAEVMATISKVPGGAFAPHAIDPCPAQTLARIDGSPNMMNKLWTFQGGEQQQFIVSASYAMIGQQTCNYAVSGGGSNTGTFQTMFDVGSGAPGGLNITPHSFDFRPPLASETQTSYIQNYGPSPSSYLNVFISGGTALTFDGPDCFNVQTCAGKTVSGGSFQPVNFKCTPGATPQSGTITYMIGASLAIQQPYTCQHFGMPPVIDITPTSVTLQGANAMPISIGIPVTGPGDNIETATIIGADPTAFTLTMPSTFCSGQSCLFNPAQPLGAGFMLTVQCTPGTTQKTATLRVKGTLHASDIDLADLSCVADSGASTSESELDFMDVKVTTTSMPKPFIIQNLSSTQPVSVTVDTGHADYLADACVSPACNIGPGGMQLVNVRFKPSVPVQNDRTLGVFVGAVQVASVDLKGNGVGSRLRVTSHMTPYLIDFGTIGLSAMRTRNVTLKADGNRNLNVVIGTPTSPVFTSSQIALDLPPGAEDDFDITCKSTSAGTFNGTVALTPGPVSNVYAVDTDKLDVRCKVANTPVQVMPDELDFGEVRRNTPPPTIDVTIFNPSAAAIPLDYVRLASPGGALSLSPPAETSLAPGAMIHASLSLATTMETTVTNALEVGVGGEQLVTPITGSVVTALARVTPTTLRLGSVCVNAEVDEPVKMVNNGTARLHVQPPIMSDPFALMFVNPINYPEGGALLSPGEEASASVRLSTATAGSVMGELTWDVDAPDAPFTIKASVEVKSEGTAVSPQAIAFDQMPVDTRSNRRTIRLENCGTEQTSIAVKGVVSSKGSVNAWEVMPSTLDTTLGPNDKRTIEVTFVPKRAGRYEARIVLTVDGTQQFIDLSGEAIGEEVERESLYACSCSAPGNPLHALPFVLVVLVVIFRRRTGSS